MERASKAGVVQQILTGDNMASSKEIIELAHQYSQWSLYVAAKS